MSYLVANPKDRFSRDVAHFIVLHQTSLTIKNDITKPGSRLYPIER